MNSPIIDSHRDDLKAAENRSKDAAGSPLLGLGENLSATYLTTGKAVLDLFTDALPDISKERLEDLLEASWSESPEATLRLIFQLGDPRRGKSDIANFYEAMLWLYWKDYDTFMLNLDCVPLYFYWKGLLELLSFVCHYGLLDIELGEKKNPQKIRTANGELRRPPKHPWIADDSSRKMQKEQLLETFFEKHPELKKEEVVIQRTTVPEKTKWANDEVRALWKAHVEANDKSPAHERHQLWREAAQERLVSDPYYASFYNKVADLFAKELLAELSAVAKAKDKGEAFSLGGLGAKWAPSLDGRHDKHTCIVDGIVERIYPPSVHKLQDGTYENYLSFMRDRYRREVIVPLRAECEVPEHFIGTARWQEVNYKRMASRCRLLYGPMFRKHDRGRYDAYLEDAQVGKNKGVNAGAVLPHEVIAASADTDRTVEMGLQWMKLIEDARSSGKIPEALCICDVSGSMHGKPMDVAVALSLLVSDLASEPWKNRICTFSANPSFMTVPSATVDNLYCRSRMVKGFEWGGNTDLVKVFHIMLQLAKEFSVPDERMPKMLFIFSDMEFDLACKGSSQTDFAYVKQLFEHSGYTMPQVVFWNLRASQSHPVAAEEQGTVMLSGYSAGLLKNFLAGRLDAPDPMSQLNSILSYYHKLRLAKGQSTSPGLQSDECKGKGRGRGGGGDSGSGNGKGRGDGRYASTEDKNTLFWKGLGTRQAVSATQNSTSTSTSSLSSGSPINSVGASHRSRFASSTLGSIRAARSIFKPALLLAYSMHHTLQHYLPTIPPISRLGQSASSVSPTRSSHIFFPRASLFK